MNLLGYKEPNLVHLSRCKVTILINIVNIIVIANIIIIIAIITITIIIIANIIIINILTIIARVNVEVMEVQLPALPPD